MSPKNQEKNKYKAAMKARESALRGGVTTSRVWMILAALGILAGLSGLSFAAARAKVPKFFVYMITRDAYGNVSFPGQIGQSMTPVNDGIIRNALKTLITEIRSVSSDPVVTRLNRYNSGYLVTPAGRNTLKTYLDAYKVEEMMANHVAVDLQFDYYTHLGENTWLVHWTDIITRNGVNPERVPMSGQFSFVRAKAKDDTWSENNPWDLYFDSFSISEAKN